MRADELEKVDAKIAAIDTEAGRMLHYAVAPGDRPTASTFAFHHADLHPPFNPEAYLDAIEAADKAADKAGYEVIVIDSFTHIWEGEGGVKDLAKAILEAEIAQKRKRHEEQRRRFEFNEEYWEDKLSTSSWDEPKNRLKRVVNRMLQSRAHIIVCLRAEEKLRIEKVKDEQTGKEKTLYIQTKDLPTAQRWVPLIERRFMYEPLASFVLGPDEPGRPFPIKLQEQHKPAVPLDQPLSENTGYLLNHWAHGGDIAEATSRQAEPEPPKAKRQTFAEKMYAKCDEGEAALQAVLPMLNDKQRQWVDDRWEDLIERARKADAARAVPY